MSESFSYTTTFVLDKVHFNECFSNSVVIDRSLSAYTKAIIFTLVGLSLALFTRFNGYFAYFMIGLGIIEALSTRYQQAWWVTRQMLSRAVNNKVTLTIDDKGIHSDSLYMNTVISWQDVREIQQTQDGVIVVHDKGRSYISNSCLSEEAKAYLADR